MTKNNEKLSRFISLLENIFELDKADLDFGIYRIMNIRKDKIKQFLSTDLPKKVQEVLTPFATATETITERIIEIKKRCDEVGIDVEKSKMADEYFRLKSQITAGLDISAIEADVYSALFSFFSRYYEEGDFISKRRYKEGVYAIPYEGEEVKLYWANADQYYIKTTENFHDYIFVSNGKKVHFHLVDATMEHNNNKESDATRRVFMLYVKTGNGPDIKTIEEVNGELIINFIYDIPSDRKINYAEKNLTAIANTIKTHFQNWEHLLNPVFSAKNETRTILEKHLAMYTAKNTYDYFIHKNLYGFLNRELDFFIKNEVIHLDDIDTTNEKQSNSYLAKIRAIKRVGRIIIDFLVQIEDFQRKLWLKKKFVVETNWCITLDYITEDFYPEIIANTRQINEWLDMYAIDEIKGDLTTEGYSNPLTLEFLRQNKNLMLDTRYFSTDFRDRCLASISNLDEQTNGLLVHSENFQALRLLRERYEGQIKCVYIDPPYNANSSEILYKNNYKHSSWLSLMYDRITESVKLIEKNFVYVIAIDEIEQEVLGQIISQIFPDNKKACISIVHNPRGQQGKNISYTHEFAYYIYPNDAKKYISDIKRSEIDSRTLRDSGTNSNRKDAATCFYPFYVRNNEIIGIGEVPKDDFHPQSNNVFRKDGIMEIWPIDDNGVEKKWRYSFTSVENIMDKLEVKNGRGAYQIIFNKDTGIMRSLWVDAKFDASEYGTKVLQNFLGMENTPKNLYPKSIYTVQECLRTTIGEDRDATVMDYFAGSGTTAHAVINLNRADKGSRKYILVEMGEYFNTVMLSRVKKVIYSTDWKDGKPQNSNTGVSHIMKYISLESYEDTLSNIELADSTHDLFSYISEDYMLRYMFDTEAKESMLSLDAFAFPFTYELKINKNNETKKRFIDLCETFNYLIGLSVVWQSPVMSFHIVPNPKGEYKDAVGLESDDNGEYRFKQIEGKLSDGRRVLIVWRTITKDLLQSNAALDAYFVKNRINFTAGEFDVIYVNGDNNLENLRSGEEFWKIQRIEPIFKAKMFGDME
ncbi:MAG: hypothetical protein LBG48_06190 [Rickettsiales bacterium]|jgi:adenine-specific DNA-methyltransferase|nr:hypothetical protein [Rickettsiales bacterium]